MEVINGMISFTLRDKLKTRLLIAESGNSLRGFSNKVNVSHCYLSQILSGQRDPSPIVASKIADGLNVKIEDIFFAKIG